MRTVHVLDLTCGAYTVDGRWVEAVDSHVLLNGHGQALEPGECPVYVPVRQGEPERNSQGEVFEPGVNWGTK